MDAKVSLFFNAQKKYPQKCISHRFNLYLSKIYVNQLNLKEYLNQKKQTNKLKLYFCEYAREKKHAGYTFI